MADNQNIGPKRLVVGAHYGVRDWLAQRITAVVMGIYTIVLLAMFFGSKNFSYDGWAGMFAMPWFKIATYVTLLCLLYHAWVGVRNIWMDYIKPASIRLLLQSATILWLIGCAVYAAEILWRV
ncbi:MAG: succinate dehydrogenase [Paucimonas sp.]|jgi:succinate dehydrogenase / fumarate reductase membrane anchor subunit|nr:succinate dehydrogenase [Paucimonas sp.]